MAYTDAITIVVPVYNAEKTIDRCVKSILNQSFKNLKLILIDDGSTDASPEICDRYASEAENITVFHQKNGGVSSARNLGIDHIETKYFSFVDSDDFLNEDYLKTLIETKNKFPDIKNIWCCFELFSDKGAQGNNIVSDSEEISFFNRNQLMTLHKLWQVQGPVCKLYDTEIVKSNNIKFDISCSLGEDLMFNLDYLDVCNTDIAIVNKCLYYYEKTQAGLDSVYRENEFEIKKDLDEYIKGYIDKWDLDTDQREQFFNSCFLGYDDMINRIAINKNIGFIKKYMTVKAILSSKEFRISFNEKKCYVNPLLNIFYKFGLCGFSIIFYYLVSKKSD